MRRTKLRAPPRHHRQRSRIASTRARMAGHRTAHQRQRQQSGVTIAQAAGGRQRTPASHHATRPTRGRHHTALTSTTRNVQRRTSSPWRPRPRQRHHGETRAGSAHRCHALAGSHRHGITTSPRRGRACVERCRGPPHDHQRNAMAEAVATTMAPLMTVQQQSGSSVMTGQHAGWHNAGQLCGRVCSKSVRMKWQPHSGAQVRPRVAVSVMVRAGAGTGHAAGRAHRERHRVTMLPSDWTASRDLASPALARIAPASRLGPNERLDRFGASRHRLDADDGMASWPLRPLEHQLQCHAGRRARVRELQFLVGNRRDDPALIGRSDEIRNRTVSMLR